MLQPGRVMDPSNCTTSPTCSRDATEAIIRHLIAKLTAAVERLPVQRVDSRTDLTSLPLARDVQVDTLDRDTVGLLLGCDVPEVHQVLDQGYGG